MKILKYTFTISNLVVEDGTLVQLGETKETHTFTLLFKGVDLYEKLSGKPLLGDIAKLNTKELQQNLDVDMIKNLAKASYVKIEGNSFHQNLVSAEEFTKTQAFARVGIDTDFMGELLNMVLDCCLSDVQKAKFNNNNSTSKK